MGVGRVNSRGSLSCDISQLAPVPFCVCIGGMWEEEVIPVHGLDHQDPEAGHGVN